MYDIFQTVWHDCGYTWEDMMEWLGLKHVPSMQIIHIEVTIIIYILHTAMMMMLMNASFSPIFSWTMPSITSADGF